MLLYVGNQDIICNHVGITAMLENMNSWEGKDEYHKSETQVGRKIK